MAATGIRACFERDTDPRVHFGLLLCLGFLGREQDVEFLRPIVGTEPELRPGSFAEEERPSPGFLRTAAALALIEIQRDTSSVEAVRILSETISNPDPVDEFLEEMPWDPPDAIELVCSVARLLGQAQGLAVLTAALGPVPESGVYSVLWHLMTLAFPEIDEYTADNPHPRREVSCLSLLQVNALRALVARDEAWHPSYSLEFYLKRLGLPARRQELSTFLG
jgi:hypothetical protein